MRQKLQAKKLTGTHDPNIPRVHRFRKNGPPPLKNLAKKEVRRSLDQAISNASGRTARHR
jgi:hypothetical protein